MTVRARLVIGLIVLAACGLAIAGAVTYRQQHDFLVQQLNQRVLAVTDNQQLLRVLNTSARTGTPVEIQTQTGDHIVAELRTPFGTGYASTEGHPPQLPQNETGFFTLHSPHYRGISTIDGFGNPYIVALSFQSVDQALHHLLWVEFIVILGVLITVALLSWWVVNLGLKPLRHMEETADAIAKGDLSRRIDVVDERTEVGRLGTALNEMLMQIEHAFDERAKSESRLRQFLADASHELRTPLTSIRGYAELFRRGAAERPEDLAKAMRRIEEEADRMGVLVEDLLLLARLDTGRPLERSPVDLTRITADAVDDMRAVAPQRPIDFTPNGAIVVPGDEVRLRQVLGNLLQNANRYTPPETPVHVRVLADDESATIEVADEGPGMAPEAAAKVFERFWRADPSRTRASGGAGLGLAIVAAIADAHGGQASVQTAPGRGATFRVRLPRKITQAKTEPPLPVAVDLD